MVACVNPRKIRVVLHIAAALAVMSVAGTLQAAAPAAATPPAAAPAPDAQAQPAAPAAPAGGARRGGGGGRGGAMTPEDQAKIAKLDQLPPWKPGLGDGDYLMTPPHNPAPENKV